MLGQPARPSDSFGRPGRAVFRSRKRCEAMHAGTTVRACTERRLGSWMLTMRAAADRGSGQAVRVKRTRMVG